jgi:hypothetical protein
MTLSNAMGHRVEAIAKASLDGSAIFSKSETAHRRRIGKNLDPLSLRLSAKFLTATVHGARSRETLLMNAGRQQVSVMAKTR